jgi:hypothetical protein
MSRKLVLYTANAEGIVFVAWLARAEVGVVIVGVYIGYTAARDQLEK